MIQKETSTLMQEGLLYHSVPLYALVHSNHSCTQDMICLFDAETKILDTLFFDKSPREVDVVRFFLTIIEHESCFIVMVDGVETPYVFHQLNFEDNQEHKWTKTKGTRGVIGSVTIKHHAGRYELDIQSSYTSQLSYESQTEVGFVKIVPLSGKKEEYSYPGRYEDAPVSTSPQYDYQVADA